MARGIGGLWQNTKTRPCDIRYKISFCVDKQIPIQSTGRRNSVSNEGTAEARMRGKREHQQRPRAYVVVVPNRLITKYNYAISQVPIVAPHTG